MPNHFNMVPPMMRGYMAVQEAEQRARNLGFEGEAQRLRNQQMQAEYDTYQQNAGVRQGGRELLNLQQQGQIQRQPDVNTLEASRAGAAAQPGRMADEATAGDLESEGKVRIARMKKEADHAETFIQAFEPVLRGVPSMNYEAANEAWEDAFSQMEKAGYDTSKYKVMDRGQLLPKIKEKYTQSVNTVAATRERIKLNEAHQRRLVEIAAQERARIAAARERLAAEKPVNSPPAVIARIMDKHRKDSKSLNDDERNKLRDWYENNLSGMDAIDYEWAYNDPERMAIRNRNRARIRKLYPDLYPNQPAANRKGPEIYRRFGLEPPK